MDDYFSKLKGQKVKVLFLDNGKTKVIKGTLKQVHETYIIVDTVIIGLGSNFISCIPQEEKE